MSTSEPTGLVRCSGCICFYDLIEALTCGPVSELHSIQEAEFSPKHFLKVFDVLIAYLEKHGSAYNIWSV